MGRAGVFDSIALPTVQSRTISTIPRCGSCGLWKRCNSPKMPVYGKGERKVLLVGEAPGETEDRQGRPFVGVTGDLLRENCSRVGVDIDQDCWTTNSLICRPHTPGGRNRAPTDKEVSYCNPPEAPIWMGDLSFKPIGDVQIGDEIIGWTREKATKHNKLSKTRSPWKGDKFRPTRKKLIRAKVLAIHRRVSVIVKVTLESGRVIRCTPDHLWADARNPYSKRAGGDQWFTAKVGRRLARVVDPVGPVPEHLKFDAGYLSGMMDGEGTWPRIAQSWLANEAVCKRVEEVANNLGFNCAWHNKGRDHSSLGINGELDAEVKFYNWCKHAKSDCLAAKIMRRSSFFSRDKIVSVEPDGSGEVVGLTTETGNYIVWGYASKNCRPNLLKTITKLQPEVIILLGGAPVKSLIGWLWKEDPGGVTRWAGWRIPCQKLNTWIAPTWHPSFVIREREKVRGKEPVAEKHFRHHLKQAFKLQGRPFKEVPDYRKQVQVELDVTEAARWLREIASKAPLIAFDYETNGITPDSPKREIVACAVSTGTETLAYPWQGEAIKATRELLLNPHIGKIGWNAKMEDRWSRAKLGIEITNWKFDGMLATHTLDNRSGICGLKFQSFVQLGQDSYDDAIKPYLRAIAKGAHAPNRIDELMRSDPYSVLLYNGMDALLTYLNALKQADELGMPLEAARMDQDGRSREGTSKGRTNTG